MRGSRGIEGVVECFPCFPNLREKHLVPLQFVGGSWGRLQWLLSAFVLIGGGPCGVSDHPSGMRGVERGLRWFLASGFDVCRVPFHPFCGRRLPACAGGNADAVAGFGDR